MDIAKAEMVEAELTRLIEKRTQQRIQEDGRTASQDAATAREALWAGSVRRYHERRRRENVAAWFGFYCRMADSHRVLSAEYERRAEKLCEDTTERRE